MARAVCCLFASLPCCHPILCFWVSYNSQTVTFHNQCIWELFGNCGNFLQLLLIIVSGTCGGLLGHPGAYSCFLVIPVASCGFLVDSWCTLGIPGATWRFLGLPGATWGSWCFLVRIGISWCFLGFPGACASAACANVIQCLF